MAEESTLDSDINEEIVEPSEVSTPLLDEWASYILSRREQYANERRAIIGREYDSNKRSWDALIEREWMVMEERLRGGLGVEREVRNYFGDSFFKDDKELLAEVIEMTAQFPTTRINLGKRERELKIYTFEDFLMLSNQGIFREDYFILDPQSKWKRKISESLSAYGFENTQSLIMEGEKYYVIGKRE